MSFISNNPLDDIIKHLIFPALGGTCQLGCASPTPISSGGGENGDGNGNQNGNGSGHGNGHSNGSGSGHGNAAPLNCSVSSDCGVDE